MPPTIDEHFCPVKQTGVALRSACERCEGRPSSGQRILDRHHVVYLGGTPADALYALVDGYLKECCTTADGGIVGIRLVRPGELVGTEALTAEFYQCTVEAIVPSRICRVPIDEANETLANDPAQGLAFSRALSRELRRGRDSMIRLAAMSAEEKVHAMIEELLEATPSGDWMRLPLSRQEISELLGLALGTVSRTVRQLERDGLFEVSGRNIRRL